jgi:hypothetical protein
MRTDLSKAMFGRRLTKVALALVLLLGAGSVGFYFAKDLVSPPVKVPPKSPDLDSTIARSREDQPKAGPISPRERPPADPRQRIIEFVNAYDGGDCFFIVPEAVEEGSATLDGLGSSVAPFEVLGYEFKRQNGFEASIGVHQIMPEQCPAVSFLFRTRNERGVAPRLDIAIAGLKEGGPLTGSISESGNRHVELLLVADDGYVSNLTALLKPSGNVKIFTTGIRKTNAAPPRPQLLIVVASSKPLEALKLPPDGSLAEQVFPQALAEAYQSGQSLNVSARYFMLEK